jgi:hypothetical protein
MSTKNNKAVIIMRVLDKPTPPGKPTPLNKLFYVGQEVAYSGVVYTRRSTDNRKYPTFIITGRVEYVTAYIAGVREPSGQLHTFTDVDIYTGAVKVLDYKSQLQAILGIKV